MQKNQSAFTIHHSLTNLLFSVSLCLCGYDFGLEAVVMPLHRAAARQVPRLTRWPWRSFQDGCEVLQSEARRLCWRLSARRQHQVWPGARLLDPNQRYGDGQTFAWAGDRLLCFAWDLLGIVA